jgi:glyoxylase-like metal-dependent hydrolase (beta-lactamase superfamily II)
MTPENIIIHRMELGPMMNFVYLAGCPSSREAAVVDPAWDAAAILRRAREADLQIRHVLLTHGHPDHINALEPLLAEVDAEVALHEEELAYVRRAAGAFGIDPGLLEARAPGIRTVSHGEIVRVGSLAVQCLHTPGHTPGSQCFLVEGCLFSGDTLFVDACGRVDTPGGDAKKMWRSLSRTLRDLPDCTLLYPGHDYGGSPTSTLGEQKRNNPYMNYESAERFARGMR